MIRVERCYLRWLPQSLRVRVSSGRRRVRAALRRRPALRRPAVALARNGAAAPAPTRAAGAGPPRSNEGQSAARCQCCASSRRRWRRGPRLLRPRLIALLWPVLFRQALPSAYALQPFMAALMRFDLLSSCGSQEGLLCRSCCALDARYKLASQRPLASCKTLARTRFSLREHESALDHENCV